MRNAFLLLLALGCSPGTAAPDAAHPTAPSTAAQGGSVTRRVVVSLSRPSGSNVTTVLPDGRITVTLDVLLNGRGPHNDATLRFAPDGTLTSFKATGHHELGTSFEETFERAGSSARWRGTEESGERSVDGAAFYIPTAELPDSIGWLAQALLKAGGALPLLPSGRAHLEPGGEATLRGPGGERHLRGYAITGLNLVPLRVWLNDDGSWFGNVLPWWSVVPEGWESAIEPLIAIQKSLDRERDAAVAKQIAHTPPAAGLAFTHARVLDVERGRWLADQTVLVVGDTIRFVGSATKARLPAGAEQIDLAGKALLPGLWDMHAHLTDGDGALDIASGVTTVRDVGNDPDELDDYHQRFDAGAAVGPHVLRFGFIEGRGEKAAPSKVTAETETEAIAAVEFYAQRGYEGIKIYNSVKPELVPLLAREAHARGMQVTGHIPVHMLAHEAVSAGYDGIEHANMLFLEFFADHDTDTRTTARFTLVGDRALAFDLESKPVHDFFALLSEHHTVIDPTLGVFEDLLCSEQGKVLPDMAPFVERLPVQTQRFFLQGGLPLDGDKRATYRASYDKMLALVAALHAAKISVVAGTDALAGLMLHHELALFVRAGLSPADALRAATIEPARVVGRAEQTGSIAPGKAADLFIVDGDPLSHIEDVSKVVSTLRGGVLYPSAAVYESVGVRPL